MRTPWRLLSFGLPIALTFCLASSRPSSAQTSESEKSWSATTEQGDPNGAENPFRTTTTHSETGGRTLDRTVVEARGPDGRYVPYSETERESVRVNGTTIRNLERSYGTNADGGRTLTQEKQEEVRNLPGGESKTVQTVSNPDANGALQVAQRTLIDSRQVSPGERDTSTTVYSADGSGGLSASVRIEEHQREDNPQTVQFTKSTSLADGTGNWRLSEVREGTTRQDAKGSSKEERVMRPDADGKMALVEQTVTRQADVAGEKRETTETYSTNVPGQAGEQGLQLVGRQTTVQRTAATGAKSTTTALERADPGDSGAGLRLTQEAIDIVRPGTDGVARQSDTVVTRDVNGEMNTVWVDMGKTDNPATVKTETAPQPKKK